MPTILTKKKRPIYLNLIQIRLPLPAFVSILHRISGVLLFVATYFVLLLLEKSLTSPEGFAQVKECFSSDLAKLVLLGISWAFLHHLFAGIRFLLLDIHKGVDLKTARFSSVLVLIASLSATLWVGVKLW